MGKLFRWLDKLASLGSNEFWMRYHALSAMIWVVSIPIAIATSIKSSIIFLVFVSLMTAFSGEMAALHGVTVQSKVEDES